MADGNSPWSNPHTHTAQEIQGLSTFVADQGGAQGPPGPAGPQGPAGSDGAQGPSGPAGADGAQGAAGADGAQGPAGEQGLQGIQGIQGLTGNDGAAGAQGDQGAQGVQGIQGVPGNDGAQGPQGIQGIQGDAGAQGEQGIQGIQGIQGEVGPTGPQGDPGAGMVWLGAWSDATAYVVGDGVSINGASYICILGHTNQQPPNGTYWGLIAAKGDTGATGADGAQGLQGDQGVQGIQGIQGEQGPAGDISGAWPIGAVFISVVSTNPATLLGFGTWEAFGAGRVLVGLDSGDTDFDTAEETGGAKTHTLTTAEIPVHAHAENAPSSASGGALKLGIDTNASGTQAAGLDTGNAGSGSAHNNLQPYICVYFFKRTA